MLIHVRVIAGEKREGVEEYEKRLIVRVKAEKKEWRANKRASELVARHFKVTPAKVRIVKGHMSPSKLFEIGER